MSSRNPGSDCKCIILKILAVILLIILFILLLVWLIFKSPNMKSKNSNVFRENIKEMRDSARDYFTDERLPQNVGESVRITLSEMESQDIIIPFVDKDGNYCSGNDSYVEVTKKETKYTMKVRLVCPQERDELVIDFNSEYSCEVPIEDEPTEEKPTEKKETVKVTEYEYKKEQESSKTVYTCSDGYNLSGKVCKKTVIAEKKEATPNYIIGKTITVAAKENKGESYRQYIDYDVNVSYSYSCPSGYTKSGSGANTTCMKSTTSTLDSTCPAGYTRSTSDKTKCVKSVAAQCPKDYKLNGNQCTYRDIKDKTACASSDYNYDSSLKQCKKLLGDAKAEKYCDTTKISYYYNSENDPKQYPCVQNIYAHYSCVSDCNGQTKRLLYDYSQAKQSTKYTCAKGTKVSTKCYDYKDPVCSTGYTPSGSTCYKDLTATPNCNTSGGTRNGGTCTLTSNATCPDSDYKIQTDGTCKKTTIASVAPECTASYTYSCPSGYTKSGSGSNTACYKVVESDSAYYCEQSDATLDLKAKTCTYKENDKFSHYSCDKSYILNGNYCYKLTEEKIDASSKTETIISYSYKWSTETFIEGWIRTGKTRTKKVSKIVSVR